MFEEALTEISARRAIKLLFKAEYKSMGTSYQKWIDKLVKSIERSLVKADDSIVKAYNAWQKKNPFEPWSKETNPLFDVIADDIIKQRSKKLASIVAETPKEYFKEFVDNFEFPSWLVKDASKAEIKKLRDEMYRRIVEDLGGTL